jgi:hypothetical protein
MPTLAGRHKRLLITGNCGHAQPTGDNMPGPLLISIKAVLSPPRLDCSKSN